MLGGSASSDKKASAGDSISGSTSRPEAETPIPQPQVLAPRVVKPKMATPPPHSSQNPLDRSKDKPATANSSTPIRITPADAAGKRPREASGGLSGPATRKAMPQGQDELAEDFENRTLSTIFRVTLDGENKTDSSGHKLTFLPNVRQELEDSGEQVRLSVAGLDSILMEACSKLPHNKPILEYLLPCWKRIMKSTRSLRGPALQKDAILKEARRLCMSSCIFALTMPELYGRDEISFKDSLVPHFLLDPEDEKGLCHEFLAEAVSRVDEDDTIIPMFTRTVAKLSFQLLRMTMNDDYKPYVQALKSLTRFPVITTAIAEDPLFLMAISAHGIEQHTLLGPFFRISVLQTEVTKSYFASPKTMDKSLVLASQSALRMTLNNHQKDLLDIVNQFVRASTSSRNRTLDWFAWIVNANHKRRALRVDEKQVSSDGFMMNVTIVLDGLCEPFMDSTFSKVSKIDADYFRRSPRIDIKDETKLNSDQKTSDKFYEEKLDGTPNFITEVFFLTVAAHHYGSEAANAKLKSLDRDITSLQKQLAIYELERPRFLSVSLEAIYGRPNTDEQVRTQDSLL
jgi:ubiquitin conjugation factor E4 B